MRFWRPMIWTKYRRTALADMRPDIPGEDLAGVSISATDHPQIGGMIARNPANPLNQWYIAGS